MLACQEGHLSIVQFLFSNQCDVNVKIKVLLSLFSMGLYCQLFIEWMDTVTRYRL